MSERNEKAWAAGYRAAWTGILETAAKNVAPGKASRAALLAERSRAIQALREVCGEFGDNDWPDSLHLADIIEKHLHRNLTDEAQFQ